MRMIIVSLLSAAVWASNAYGAQPQGQSADEIVSPHPNQPSGEQGTLTLAEHHFQTGVEFYQAGRYEAAQVEFEAAYGLSKLPDLLHNLSLVTERLARFAEAISFEERFLKEKAEELSTNEIDQSRGRLLRLRDQMKSGGSAVSAAASAEVKSSPGTIVVDKAKLPLDQSRKLPVGALILLGSGAGLVAISIGCGVGALVTSKTVSDGGQFYLADYQALVDRGNALDRVALSFGIIGGSAIVAGGAWWIYRRTHAH